MTRTMYILFIVFECIRFVLWTVFLVWLTCAYDANTWRGPEALLIPSLVAFWLGFPYAWIATYLAGTSNLLHAQLHVPISIAFVNFLVWLLVTTIIAFFSRSSLNKERESLET